MERILKNTLICFSKLCKEKNEKAHFYGKEKSALGNFFYNESKKYPRIFEGISFSTGGNYYKSPELENEWNNMSFSGMLESFAPDFHPFEVPNLHKLYGNVENKESFNKIALNFYNELGCLVDGRMRKDLEKTVNNNS
jgi:hypothetical protein